MIDDIVFTVSALSALIGAVGALRFPDFYTRAHALTMVTVGGTVLGLLVFAATEGFSAYSVKSLIVAAFILLTSPVSAHAIAQAAHSSGLKPASASKDALDEKKKAK